MLRAQRGMHSYYTKRRNNDNTLTQKMEFNSAGFSFFVCGVVESTFHPLFGIKAKPLGERDKTKERKKRSLLTTK